MVDIDFDKIGKFSKAGPRYTSYPTAVEFESSDEVRDEYLKELKESDKPLSLYFHLPFCRSACYFCGCNVLYTSKESKRERYIGYLEKELRILSENMETSREVIQMHFGGGTPTFFSANELERIIKIIKDTFSNFSDKAEISCEVDPRFLDKNQMKVLRDGGFNRISFGVQDFDKEVQEAIHRVQSYEVVKTSNDLARDSGISSVNIDLIYGLPFQNLEKFKDTLEKSVSMNPERFAVFNYAHVPWLMKTMRKIDEHTLPEPTEKLKILKYTIDYLIDHGYKMVGMDHFAKPDDELFLAIERGELHRNFQGYTTKGGATLLGIGLTSIGEGDGYYIQNFKEMSDYEDSLDRGELPIFRGVKLSEDDKIRKYVIMELMSNFKFDITRFDKRFRVRFHEYFKNELDKLQIFVDGKLLMISEKSIETTFTGGLIIRNIAMVFDAYMKKHVESKKTFSKTI